MTLTGLKFGKVRLRKRRASNQSNWLQIGDRRSTVVSAEFVVHDIAVFTVLELRHCEDRMSGNSFFDLRRRELSLNPVQSIVLTGRKRVDAVAAVVAGGLLLGGLLLLRRKRICNLFY